MSTWQVRTGDCRALMAAMPEASVDAIVTDPPYGIGFMGKEWDSFKPDVLAELGADHEPIDHKKQRGRASSMHAGEYDRSAAARKFQAWAEAWGREALRVLKPGGHAVVFGGPRAFHRMTAGLEDAGFEIRDCLAWLFGSGFPKSLDVSKAIDRAAGAVRAVVGPPTKGGVGRGNAYGEITRPPATAPATAPATEWNGWGTALKPAWEPCILARKPLAGTVAGNVLAHGTGALNVDACRIEAGDEYHNLDVTQGGSDCGVPIAPLRSVPRQFEPASGRWPANVLLDEAAAAELDGQAGECGAGGQASGPTRVGPNTSETHGARNGTAKVAPFIDDAGGPSRFFYTAKAAASEREDGTESLPTRTRNRVNPGGLENDPKWSPVQRKNHHPTVKPVDLMSWLCRLVTRPGGVILDPFAGSGSTGVAAVAGGWNFIGLEIEPEYVAIARARIGAANPLFSKEIACPSA